MHGVLVKFNLLKKKVTVKESYSDGIASLLTQIYEESLSCLDDFSKANLKSEVPNKEYFAFENTNTNKISRPINKSLYDPDLKEWKRLMTAIEKKQVTDIPTDALQRTLYSMAISFCASIDMLKKGDKATPGAFFGKFVAFFFASQLGVQPVTHVNLMNYDDPKVSTKLPTDLIFDMGNKKQKFHVPVKTSSRERAIMLWAHQRLVDGAYGVERFMGTPVLLAETKGGSEARDVTEICLADQWRVYQLYIARLKRIYYLDLPEPYAELNNEFPPICVKPFAEFFYEWKDLMPA
jgi:hypothetical protein